jgi:hypothetical protein
MKRNFLKRLEVVEREVNMGGKIPDKEKIVVIAYPNGDTEQFEHLKKQRMAELREKHGPGISENDVLIVAIRKFYRESCTQQ